MKKYLIVFLLLLTFMLLVACQGEVQQAVEEVAPTVQAAVEEVAPTIEAAVEEVAPTVEAAVEEATEEEAVVNGRNSCCRNRAKPSTWSCCPNSWAFLSLIRLTKVHKKQRPS